MDEHKARKTFPMFYIFACFNLIEVTLSIAIVGIGITGVVSLFPQAISSTRDAIGENYSSHVANQFLVYIARNCNNPTKNYGSGARDFWEEYIYPAPSNSIPESIPTVSDETSAIFSTTASDPNIYTSSSSGLYRVKQGSASYTDFFATARVWKSKIQNVYIADQNNAEISYQYTVRINIEISWPVEKAYARRDKRYYSMELFRQ